MIGYGNSMFLATHGILARSASGGAVDPDAQAFITAASITDPTQQSAINQLVVDLKGYNIWTKMKALYPFVGGTATTHKFNLKDPRDLDAAFRLQFFGDITHSSNGIVGGGVTNYVDTFCNPLNNLTSNSIHVSFYSRTNIEALMNDIGVNDFKEILTFPRYATNTLGFGVQCDSSSRITTTNNDSRGLFISNRTASNIQNAWRNGNKLVTGTQNSVLRPNGNIWITAWNNLTNPNFLYRSTRQLAFASIGDGLTDTEAANFYTAVQAFQVSLSRNV